MESHEIPVDGITYDTFLYETRKIAIAEGVPNPQPLYTTDALAQARADAQKDAARYRWLADAERFSARWQIVRLEWWRGNDGWEPLAKQRLDAAIDAAISKEKRDE